MLERHHDPAVPVLASPHLASPRFQGLRQGCSRLLLHMSQMQRALVVLGVQAQSSISSRFCNNVQCSIHIGSIAPVWWASLRSLHEHLGLRLPGKLNKEKGWDIKIHIDGASGGFVVPFLYPEMKWDFRCENVVSINASGHKCALA